MGVQAERQKRGNPLIGAWSTIGRKETAIDRQRACGEYYKIKARSLSEPGHYFECRHGHTTCTRRRVSKACDMFGYMREELLQLHMKDTYVYAEQALAQQRLEEVRAHK